MYAFLLIVLLLLLYWYSRREPPPVVYVEPPIIPDLTNTINTGPTDMTLVLPVAAVDNSVYTSSSVDNSLVPVTPPIGPSVYVPDMTSTDVMNTSTPSAPIVTGGAVVPPTAVVPPIAVDPPVAKLVGDDIMKQSNYNSLLNVYRQKIRARNSAQQSVDSYLPMLNSTREKVKNAELKFNSAKVAESQALTNLNNAIASKEPNLIITNLKTMHGTSLNNVNASLQEYNSIKTILASREAEFVKRQKDASLATDNANKAELDAFNAHMALYGRPPPVSTGIRANAVLAPVVQQSISAASTAASTVASTVASAFGNLSSFLNYRSGYSLRGY